MIAPQDTNKIATPAWAVNAPLNAWMEIPGTGGAGGTPIESYSGWAKLPNGKIAITLAGGHTDGTKNSTVVINMLDDQPKWVEVSPESPTHTYEVAYEADGKPTSTHTYYTTMWVPTTNRLMRVGAGSVSLSGNTYFLTVDGFDFSTNTWDKAGTYKDLPKGGRGGCYNPQTGEVLLDGGVGLYNPTTGVTRAIVTDMAYPPRSPWVWDSVRNQFFGLCFGDNQEYSVTLGVVAAKGVDNKLSKMTINESAAKAQFIKDIPYYAAMEHDPVNDCFLFYTGSRIGTAGRVYKIIPNATNAWDISIFEYGAGSITPVQTIPSGIMNKFSYIPELGGIVMMTNKKSNLYFMKTTGAGSGGVVIPPVVPPVVVPPVVPSSSALVTVALKSPVTQTAAPFSFGHTFKRGDVPVGSKLVGENLQVTPLNLWSDGSLKFAHVAGTAALTANASLPIILAIGTPVVGTVLDTAALRATNVVSTIGCGVFGTVGWATTDWDTPFDTLISGPKMSSWRYRKPVGTDPHLVAWLEVSIFAGGKVEVFPWIENGYTRVAAPTNKSETFTFTLGNTQRFSAAIDLKHHQRTPLINGTALSYWLDADPQVTPTHDKAYLQASELVPTYSAKMDSKSAEVGKLVSSYTPLQAGNLTYDQDYMGSSGYQAPIGLLPTSDVVYLTSDAETAYAAVVRNGFSAGRYSSHFRDESTNKPILFSKYPNFTLKDSQGFKDNGGSTTGDTAPAAIGGNGPTWDTAHRPNVAYLAYLLTARRYFAEEVQFAANFDYIGMGDNQYLRVGATGLMRPCVGAWQTRSFAWAWLGRAAALTVTPDSDTALRGEYIRTFHNNVDNLHDQYITKPNNPWGVVQPGEMYDNDNYHKIAIWQQNFVNAAIGYSLCMELPLDTARSTKLNEFYQWKAKSSVITLGTKEGFWYVNPAPYQLAISPATTTLIDYATGKGPWLTSEADIYKETYTPQPANFSITEGVLQSEYTPDSWVTSMMGNLVTGVAYAVRHKVKGAAEGYARLTSATNYPTFAAYFNVKPVWSVKPASGALPSTNVPPVVVPPIVVPPVIVPPVIIPPVITPPVIPPFGANFTVILPAKTTATSYEIRLDGGIILQQTLPATTKALRLRIIIEEI